jgi:hypothetical protein
MATILETEIGGKNNVYNSKFNLLDSAVMKTLVFEEKYKINIEDFPSTKEIDKFIEKKAGKKLKVIRINTNILGD